MVLTFRGTAHPPPGLSEPDVANLSAAEIATTDLTGKPLLFEHSSGHKVGVCHASWEGTDGSLRVQAVVDDPATERSMRAGKHQGLSLGTDVVQDVSGKPLYKGQVELSVCDQPRRPMCYVDNIDGADTRRRRRFSAGKHFPAKHRARPTISSSEQPTDSTATLAPWLPTLPPRRLQERASPGTTWRH